MVLKSGVIKLLKSITQQGEMWYEGERELFFAVLLRSFIW